MKLTREYYDALVPKEPLANLEFRRRVCVEHPGKIGSGLGGDHRQDVAAKRREERQCERDLGDAAVLTWTIRPEEVEHRGDRHAVILAGRGTAVAGVLFQDVVKCSAPAGVECNA